MFLGVASILSWRLILVLTLLVTVLQAINILLYWSIEAAKKSGRYQLIYKFSDNPIGRNSKYFESQIVNTPVKTDSYYKNATNNSSSKRKFFKNGLPVEDNKLTEGSYIDDFGLYRVAENVFKSSFNLKRSLFTLATQGSVQHLDKVIRIVERWEGPVSVCFFALTSEVRWLAETLLKMKTCIESLNHVTFSVVTPISGAINSQGMNHIDEEVLNVLLAPLSVKHLRDENIFLNNIKLNDRNFSQFSFKYNRRKRVINHQSRKNVLRYNTLIFKNNTCSSLYKEFIKLSMQNDLSHDSLYNYEFLDVQYPNNLLRNIAIKSADSEYVLLLDIDMLPSSGLFRQFTNFITKMKESLEEEERVAFVVPSYEVQEIEHLPETKEELLKLVQAGQARPFYDERCRKCQFPTNYSAWEKLRPHSHTGVLYAAYEVFWRDPWEPFYISNTRHLPRYDERFRQYGFNRISQVCEAHVAGYKFKVLSPAFVVHRGFKRVGEERSRQQQELDSNRLLYRQFKQELKLKYSQSSRRCY